MRNSTSGLPDPATYGILNSELTNCPRTAAVLGELATQWQHMMRYLQRVEQETVSSQNLANAVENMNRIRIDAMGNRLRLKDGDDRHVEPVSELAEALANVTGGAARSAVLKVTQVEPSRGFVAWRALVDGYAPQSSNDPVKAPQPKVATPKRCKDAKELK